MIWVIVIIFVLIVVVVLIDISANFLSFTHQLFSDSLWVILGVISGIVSLIFFYGTTKSYREVKINESLLPNPNKSKLKTKEEEDAEMSIEKRHIEKTDCNSLNIVENEIPEFDLSQMTLATLTEKMVYEMTKPGPVFFKAWGNERLKLDVERVQILGEYIEAIRKTGSSLMNLQSDAVLSQEALENLIKVKRNVLIKELDESRLEIDLVNAQYKSKIEELNLNIKNLEIEIREKIAVIEQTKAQTAQIYTDMDIKLNEAIAKINRETQESISKIKQRERESSAEIDLNKKKGEAEIYVLKLKARDNSKISKLREKALDEIIKEMKFDHINPMQLYTLIKLLDTGGNEEFTDFDSKIKIMKEELEKMKIDNDKSKAEAKEAHARANEIKAQSDLNVNDMYKAK